MTTQQNRADNQLRFIAQKLANIKPDITSYQASLNRRRDQLKIALHRQLFDRKIRLENIRRNLHLLSPELVLQRGYSIVEYRGAILRNAGDVETGDALLVRLAAGRIEVAVTGKADGNPLSRP